MAIGNAGVTTGKAFANAEDVTTTSINLLGVPTVALGFTGDPDTGLSNPSANILGIEVGGAEICRFTATGIATKFGMFRDVNTAVLSVHGGTSGNGANIELYGGAHATLANLALVDADVLRFRPQDGSSNRMSVTSSGVAIGATGNAIKAIWYDSVGVTSNIGGSSVLTADVTITGAAIGDIVHVCWASPTGAFNYVSMHGYVHSANTVRWNIINHDTGSISVNENIKVTVLDIT